MMELLSPQVIHEFLERVQDICAEPPVVKSAPSFEKLGRGWGGLGVRPGDVVLLALPNGIGLLRQFFAVLAAGGVPALVAPNTPSARLQELAAIFGARSIGAVRLPGGLSGVERQEVLDQIQVGLLPAARSPTASPGEVILLTSGTSGFSSGCVFGLEALLLNASRHADSIGQRTDDVVLINLPLNFSFALVAQALATLLRGGQLVISGPPFHVPSYLKAVAEHGVTLSSLTPILVKSLLKCPRPPGLRLRVLTVGGDSLPADQVEQLLDRLPGTELYLTYGLTQAGPRVSTLAAHRESPRRYASVGLPLAGTDVRLEDVDDDSGSKQLIVSSQTVMRRRIGLVEGRPGNDLRVPGVVATGDAFERDSDGYLYFRGRLSDFIVRGGEKICLEAVRRVAAQLPHVLRARTRLVAKPDGEADFDLTLVTTPAARLSATDYRARLGSLVRRSELPRNIDVQFQDAGHCLDYK